MVGRFSPIRPKLGIKGSLKRRRKGDNESDERMIMKRISPVCPGPVLKCPAGADLRALQLSLGLCVRIELVLHKSVDKGTHLSI